MTEVEIRAELQVTLGAPGALKPISAAAESAPTPYTVIINGANVTENHTAKPRTEAVRASISRANKGRPSQHRAYRHTAASRRGMRAGCKQRHQTDWVEHVREAAKAAWARRRAEASR
jgi:hypothetical protein